MPIIKLKGTSPLKENVSQNAIKEPPPQKMYHISFDIGSYKSVTFRLATRQTRIWHREFAQKKGVYSTDDQSSDKKRLLETCTKSVKCLIHFNVF